MKTMCPHATRSCLCLWSGCFCCCAPGLCLKLKSWTDWWPCLPPYPEMVALLAALPCDGCLWQSAFRCMCFGGWQVFPRPLPCLLRWKVCGPFPPGPSRQVPISWGPQLAAAPRLGSPGNWYGWTGFTSRRIMYALMRVDPPRVSSKLLLKALLSPFGVSGFFPCRPISCR